MKNNLPTFEDPLLTKIVEKLVKKHKCHTVLLYRSRARGDATDQSDYDVMGVCKTGKKFRVAEKRKGVYLDLFIFPEKDLKELGENHLYMLGSKILYEKSHFGSNFLQRLDAAGKIKYKPLPADEIEVRKIWLHKMFDRISVGDIEGNYRRAWLHEALLYEYFAIRKKRYLGSKQSFAWLKEKDPATYRLFDTVLANPLDLKHLKRLVVKVSRIKI